MSFWDYFLIPFRICQENNKGINSILEGKYKLINQEEETMKSKMTKHHEEKHHEEKHREEKKRRHKEHEKREKHEKTEATHKRMHELHSSCKGMASKGSRRKK